MVFFCLLFIAVADILIPYLLFFQTKIKTQAPVTIIDANFDLNDPNEEYQKCQQQILNQGMKN